MLCVFQVAKQQWALRTVEFWGIHTDGDGDEVLLGSEKGLISRVIMILSLSKVMDLLRLSWNAMASQSGICQRAACIHIQPAFNVRTFQDTVENHRAPGKKLWSTGPNFNPGCKKFEKLGEIKYKSW